jgi:hypothetical protein
MFGEVHANDVELKTNYGSVLRFFFSGTAARGALQDVKRERPKSRFGAV